MAVVGPKEVETQIVTVRSRFGGELGTMILKILSVEPSLLHKIEHHFKNAKCLSSNWMGIRVPAKLPMVLIFEDLYTWNVFLYLFLDS
ncbi:unnamed protein product, partial [Vitis vinifera]